VRIARMVSFGEENMVLFLGVVLSVVDAGDDEKVLN
jgi:hypothetical protein